MADAEAGGAPGEEPAPPPPGAGPDPQQHQEVVFASQWERYAATTEHSSSVGIAWAVILGAAIIACFVYSRVLARREEEKRNMVALDAARKEEEAKWRKERIEKSKAEREQAEKEEAERKIRMRQLRKEEEDRKAAEFSKAKQSVISGHQSQLDAYGDDWKKKQEEERLAKEERRRKARADQQDQLLANDLARMDHVGQLQGEVDSAASARRQLEREEEAARLERRRAALKKKRQELLAEGEREGKHDAARAAAVSSLQDEIDCLPLPGTPPPTWYGDEDASSPLGVLGGGLGGLGGGGGGGGGAGGAGGSGGGGMDFGREAIPPGDPDRELREGTIEISRERRLKAAQDAELRESLAKDRARDDRKKRSEQERLDRIARIARQEEEAAARRDELVAKFADRPAPEPGRIAHVRFRLPRGGVLQYKFADETPMAELFEYVEAHGGMEPGSSFSLVADYPRRVFGSDEAGTLEAAGLVPQATLLVQPEG